MVYFCSRSSWNYKEIIYAAFYFILLKEGTILLFFFSFCLWSWCGFIICHIKYCKQSNSYLSTLGFLGPVLNYHFKLLKIDKFSNQWVLHFGLFSIPGQKKATVKHEQWMHVRSDHSIFLNSFFFVECYSVECCAWSCVLWILSLNVFPSQFEHIE